MRQTLSLYSIFSQFVTTQILYTECMNIFLSYFLISPPYGHALLTPALTGFLCLLVLLIFSFIIIHLVKLALIGWEHCETKKDSPQKAENPGTDTEEQTKNKAPAPSSQEPIYYIVEKKTKRAKPSYGEPKQIRFK